MRLQQLHRSPSQHSLRFKAQDMSHIINACREAEEAASIARTRYDEAKQQREVAEAKNQSFKQLEQQHLSSEWVFLQLCIVVTVA